MTGFASIQVKSRVNSGDLKNRLKKGGRKREREREKRTIEFERKKGKRFTMTVGHLHEQVIHDVVVVSPRSIGQITSRESDDRWPSSCKERNK